MAVQLKSIRGVHDGLPQDVRQWQQVEQRARAIFKRYAFEEVRLPILEPTELFVRSIGEATDIVSKEMYHFVDQGGDDLCLRPEGTAGAVRAFLQAGLTRAGAQRWFYAGPMFRRERPQKGRLRQFQQIGVEWFGGEGPSEDIELLAMAAAFLEDLGISQVRMEINSLGCQQCRPLYRDLLVKFLTTQHANLCETCCERMDKNPLRVLDCKIASCQNALTDAPEMVAHLCEGCDQHFTGLKSGLDALKVPYRVNPRIVRGLDYYNRTAFEAVTDQLGSQGTVLAGGRYDGLVAELGGEATPAIGFAMGVERLAMLLPEAESASVDVAVITMGDALLNHSLNLAQQLRHADLCVVHCGLGNSKKQFKRANREQARFVVVIGESEAAQGLISLKNMATGEQQQITLEAALQVIAG
ncbi:MAG: histidine--tRNA ligase [Zetaproteobacteria bacterium]|nr:histidine--tRNA ligase [Zetaproteobacteria bacterium]